MADESNTTKAELKAAIASAWEALWAYLSQRTPEELTGLQDAEGWTVKDHLAHLAAWEQSVSAMFQGQPRHQALGIDLALYQSEDFDAQNAVIQQQRKDLTLQETLDQMRSAHSELMDHLESISDADLNRPADQLYPEIMAGETRAPGQIVFANTAEHYAEHLGWIRTLCESGGDPA